MTAVRTVVKLTMIAISVSVLLALACSEDKKKIYPPPPTVPHEADWGIYSLDLATETTELVFSCDGEITVIRLNDAGDRFVFSMKIGGDNYAHTEICTVDTDGSNFTRLTNNSAWDLYPAWSPDSTRIAFLSFRNTDLDIFVMNADGSNQSMLYDSGSHDADVHWRGNRIVFTNASQIWSIQDDGTDPLQLTDPPNAGVWGNANLPFGDYDPRFNDNAGLIVFERLEDDISFHGNYNLYIVNSDGTGETRLTDTGYSQGMAAWSHSGDMLVYIVGAIGAAGVFDIYMINSDGTDNRDIIPYYYPPVFLCHDALFSPDDSRIYFVGQWWN